MAKLYAPPLLRFTKSKVRLKANACFCTPISNKLFCAFSFFSSCIFCRSFLSSSATGAFLAAIAAALSSFFLASAAKAALRASSLARVSWIFYQLFCRLSGQAIQQIWFQACSSVKAPFLTPPCKCFLYKHTFV
jgi:hypothetical protein